MMGVAEFVSFVRLTCPSLADTLAGLQNICKIQLNLNVCICTLHCIFQKYRGGVTSPNFLNYFSIDLLLVPFWVINMSPSSTDQQIDGFTFMGTSIKELRETISTIGDRAKCTRLKEQLENLEVRMIPNRQSKNLHIPPTKGIRNSWRWGVLKDRRN